MDKRNLKIECPECSSNSITIPNDPKAQVVCANGHDMGTIAELNERNTKKAGAAVVKGEVNKMIRRLNAKPR